MERHDERRQESADKRIVTDERGQDQPENKSSVHKTGQPTREGVPAEPTRPREKTQR